MQNAECIRQANFDVTHDDLHVTSPLNFMEFMFSIDVRARAKKRDVESGRQTEKLFV